uniref:Uncharacterized protein n=1 Tax=Timema bartmani TaxID=61472 RepID=A0A7R9F1C4_9NEOP|nr:unnamed protein product [Timema bartmani]
MNTSTIHFTHKLVCLHNGEKRNYFTNQEHPSSGHARKYKVRSRQPSRGTTLLKLYQSSSRQGHGVVMAATRCLVAVLALVATTHGFGLEDTLAVLKLGREVIGDVFEAWGVFKERAPDTKQVEFPLLHMRETEVIKRLTQISQKVDHMGKELQFTVDSTLGAILTQLPSLVRLELHLEDLSRSVIKVDASYRQMTRYVKEGYDNETGEWRLENFTLENLAEQGVSHDPDSVRGLLDRIHVMLAPHGSGFIDRGLLIPLRNSMQVNPDGTKLISCRLTVVLALPCWSVAV